MYAEAMTFHKMIKDITIFFKKKLKNLLELQNNLPVHHIVNSYNMIKSRFI